MLEQAATIAWTHHEQFDGDGYPRGLVGEEIPLIGRLAASGRRLRRADEPTGSIARRCRSTDALAILIAERGRQFDPAVVDAFLADVEEVRAILVRFADEVARAPESRRPRLPSRWSRSSTPRRLSVSSPRAAAALVRRGADRDAADRGRPSPVPTGCRPPPGRRTRVRVSCVRPLQPPATPIPALAQCLRENGTELAATAAAALYRGGREGWFAGEDAAAARRRMASRAGPRLRQRTLRRRAARIRRLHAARADAQPRACSSATASWSASPK